MHARTHDVSPAHVATGGDGVYDTRNSGSCTRTCSCTLRATFSPFAQRRDVIFQPRRWFRAGKRKKEGEWWIPRTSLQGGRGGRSQKTAATYVGRGREGIDVGSLLFSRRFPLYGKKKKCSGGILPPFPFLFLSIRRRLNNHMEEFHLPD